MKRQYFILLVMVIVITTSINVSNANILTITTMSDTWLEKSQNNQVNVVSMWGEESVETYGQTFTIEDTDLILQSCTFYVRDVYPHFESPDFVDFSAIITEWSGSKSVGPVLYNSGALTTTDNGGVGGFEAVALNIDALYLESGKKYAIFFSASDYFDGVKGTAEWGLTDLDCAYTGGGFIYANTGEFLPQVDDIAWVTTLENIQDLAFEMNFEIVPIPSSVILGGLGLTFSGWMLKRKRMI